MVWDSIGGKDGPNVHVFEAAVSLFNYRDTCNILDYSDVKTKHGQIAYWKNSVFQRINLDLESLIWLSLVPISMVMLLVRYIFGCTYEL